MNKKCKICGQVFIPRNIRNITCSSICLKEHSKIRRLGQPKTEPQKAYNREYCRRWRLENPSDISYQREYNGRLIKIKKCVVCENEFETYYTHKMSCSPNCSSSLHRMNKRKSLFARYSAGKFPPNNIIEKRLSLFSACCYCGKDSKLVIDHLVPISEGGTNDYFNLYGSCVRCNSSKGKKEWIAWYRKQEFYKPENEIRILRLNKNLEIIRRKSKCRDLLWLSDIGHIKSCELGGYPEGTIPSQAGKPEGVETIRKEYTQASGSAGHRKVKI